MSEFRPVAAIDLEGTVAADLGWQPEPDYDIVDPIILLIDEVYQRGMNRRSRRHILRMVRDWNWAKFKPPICCWVNGRLHVLDGQHTAIAAATHPGIKSIFVIIVSAPEEADRAKAFVSHATDKLQATPMQVWRAAVAAGDEDAIAIKRALDAAEVEMLLFPPPGSKYQPNQTIALAAVRRVVVTHGTEKATEALSVCRQAGLGVTAELIKVVSELLFGLDYQGTIDAEQIISILTTLGPRLHEEARALALAKRISVWKALVAVVNRAKRPKPKVSFDPETGRFEGSAEVVAITPSKDVVPLPKPSPTARRVIDRRPVGPVNLGEPDPDRSALAERRRQMA